MGRYSKRQLPKPRSRGLPIVCAFIGGVGIASLVAALVAGSDSGSGKPAAVQATSDNRGDVMRWLRNLPPAFAGANSDIALLNLACCADLGDKAAELDVDAALAELDRWATTIRLETDRNFHRYLADPEEFGSEAAWRLAMMSTVLGQELGIRYDPELAGELTQTAPDTVFFRDPSRVFLTGLLGKDRVGTCSSLPVLYVALGRRLDYPLHLVTAKNHLFVRWDDGKGAKVNMEAACNGGFLSRSDDHYRQWPAVIRPEEERELGYLANLQPPETLALFLTTRAVCLSVAGRHEDAYTAASQAYQISPNLAGVAVCLARNLPDDIHSMFRQSAITPALLPPIPPDPSPLIRGPSTFAPGLSGHQLPSGGSPATNPPTLHPR